MNAYELADKIEDARNETDFQRWASDAPDMLRQQADRIAELEKQSEPIAWVYETKNVDGEPYLTDVSLKPLFGLVTRYGYKEIPLYTHPVKQLSEYKKYRMAVKEFGEGFCLTYRKELLNYANAIIKEITE